MAHLAQSPSFILHQVTCQFATGLPFWSAESFSGTVSVRAGGPQRQWENTSAAPAGGLDEPANGHIERTGTQVYVAQQQDILPHTTLAELLGYEAIFAARARVDSGEYQPDDLETLDGFWDLAERLSEAFARARLPPFDPDKPTAELSGGERVRALLCGAFTAQADYLLLDEPTNHGPARPDMVLRPACPLSGRCTGGLP